jgi:hypothetical protein
MCLMVSHNVDFYLMAIVQTDPYGLRFKRREVHQLTNAV